MTQKYKLLPVQVENLKKQYDESVVKLQALNVVKNEALADSKAASGKELNLGLDTSLIVNLSVVISNYKQSKQILENHEVIEQNNSDIIGLGSTFEISVDYGEGIETEVCTLVEVHNVCDDSNLISVVSPLGNAVLGKKAGDSFGYKVESGMIIGTVTDIIKQKTL